VLAVLKTPSMVSPATPGSQHYHSQALHRQQSPPKRTVDCGAQTENAVSADTK